MCCEGRREEGRGEERIEWSCITLSLKKKKKVKKGYHFQQLSLK